VRAIERDVPSNAIVDLVDMSGWGPGWDESGAMKFLCWVILPVLIDRYRLFLIRSLRLCLATSGGAVLWEQKYDRIQLIVAQTCKIKKHSTAAETPSTMLSYVKQHNAFSGWLRLMNTSKDHTTRTCCVSQLKLICAIIDDPTLL